MENKDEKTELNKTPESEEVKEPSVEPVPEVTEPTAEPASPVDERAVETEAEPRTVIRYIVTPAPPARSAVCLNSRRPRWSVRQNGWWREPAGCLTTGRLDRVWRRRTRKCSKPIAITLMPLLLKHEASRPLRAGPGCKPNGSMQFYHDGRQSARSAASKRQRHQRCVGTSLVWRV